MRPSATPRDGIAESRADLPVPISRATRRPRTLGKRIAFGVLTTAGVCLITEFAALVVFGLVDGRPFSYTRVQTERDELLQAISGSARTGTNGDSPAPEFLRSKSLHPYVGYVATPNFDSATIDAKNGRLPTHFGYYDANPILARSNDTAIVAIVGGSVAYGFGLPAATGEPSGIEVLQQRLLSSPRYAGKKFVFLRLALSGYKQPQQLMTISYLLSLGAEFDVVINIDGFNEVALHPAENAKTGTFAAYPRMWSFQTAERTQQSAGRYLSLNFRRSELAKLFSQTGWRHSIVANLVWRLRDRALGREIYEAQQSMLTETSGNTSYESTGPTREYADEAAMMNDLVAIWKRSSQQLDRLCRANGIAYYHVLQPNQYVPGSKRLTPAEQADAYDANQPYRRGAEMGYPLLIRAGKELKQQGVHFLDLSQAFADVEETLYIDNCCHFNDRGNAIVADRIAEEILSNFEAGTLNDSGGKLNPSDVPTPNTK